MTTRRRTIPPVPMSPIHRRSWRSLWRRCSCGLKEPCVDRLTTPTLYLPMDQDPPPAPPPPPPVQPQASRHPDGSIGQVDGNAAGLTVRRAGPDDGYAAAVPLDRTARPPGSARMRRSASARVPVRQPGRAGSLTPAQARRADHAERRQDLPQLREAVPGRADGSGPPHDTDQVPARNRPGPGRDWSHDERRVGDSTS